MKRLLMAFTAIAALAGPLAAPIQAVAQDQQAHGRRDRGERARPERSRPERPRQEQSERPAAPRPERPRIERPRPNPAIAQEGAERAVTPRRPERPSRPEEARPQRLAEGAGRDRADRRDRDGPRRAGADGGQSDRLQTRPEGNRGGEHGRDRTDDRGRGDGRWNGNGQGDRRWDGRRDGDGRGNRPDRPRQDRPDHRPDRDARPGRHRHDDFRNRFNREQWRRDFYRNHRADWWRNDRRFRGYSGVRIGFYFAPGWGYYSVPRSYWGRTWSVGQYLPDTFWRYRLDDWRTYGLGYPPEGTRWVSVDNTIYLIDEYDGYIIDVLRNAWNW